MFDADSSGDVPKNGGIRFYEAPGITVPHLFEKFFYSIESKMANVEEVGTQFLEAYFATFRNNREGLISFYGPSSTVVWEGNVRHQPEAIAAGLARMSATKLEYVHIDKDIRQGGSNGILILVTGQVRIDDAPPVGFSQVFELMPSGPSWYSK